MPSTAIRTNSFPTIFVYTLLFCVGVTTLISDAQEPVTAVAPPPVAFISSQSVEEQLKRAEAATDLDEDNKKKVVDLLRQALEHAKRSETLISNTASFEAAVKTVDQRADAFKDRAKELKEAKPPTTFDDVPLAELEQSLTTAEQLFKEFSDKVTKSDTDIGVRVARLKTIRDRLNEAKRELEAMATQTVTVVPDAELLNDAKNTEFQTQRQVLEAEIPALTAELALLNAENDADLPRLQRDELAMERAAAEENLQGLQAAVQSGRTEEAKKQLSKAQSEARRETNPLLLALAERNVELAEQYASLNELNAAAEKELKETLAVRDDWKKEDANTKKQVKTVGLTNATGAMLRQQKLKLPNPRVFRARVAELSPLVSNAQLTWMKLEEERSRDLDEIIRRSDTLVPPTSSEVRGEADALIEKRNKALVPLRRAQNEYFSTLVDLSNAKLEIANQISLYEAFIDERVLWVRSSDPMLSSWSFERNDESPERTTASRLKSQIGDWLFDRGRWQSASQSMLDDCRKNVAVYLIAMISFFILLRKRFAFRSLIQEYGDAAESGSCTQFSPTVSALLLTILGAAPWPAFFAFLSWRMSSVTGSNEVLRAFAHGFQNVAVAYFPLEFFRLACRPQGLAESHFGWPSKSVQLVRRHIRAVMLISLPLVMLMATLSSTPSVLRGDLLDRITFMVITVTVSLFLGRVLDPQSGALSGYFARNAGGWASRLQPVWYWLIVLSPLMLTGLTFFGYFYTAQQLGWRLFATACLLGGVLFATAFISRMLLVQRRRLSIEQAKQRRAAQLKVSKDETALVVAEELPSPEDLRAQISQSQRLLRTVMVGVALAGIWIAWVDVLPALGFLEQWPLWKSTVQETELVTNDAGEATYKTREVIDPVTIADIALSIVVFGLTLVSARNIPGVLEISILQRLPIDASVRYAITTIVSYVILLVGSIVACGTIGIHWNQVQWMATALTFGLAFGLQEMFANFVAGIIILFERPIRVGDIVTVDDVSGTVSRVQIRATTITNWDRKDYIVPNKDFITGRVLNWTLSDQFNRIVVSVGVAYGSDTKKVIENIGLVANEHPTVVDDPAPVVTFEEFGASSLNFTLRCYIAMKDMPSRLQVVHDLHMAIDDIFRRDNIEIAFPQQDIHIRSAPPNEPAPMEPAIADVVPANGSSLKNAVGSKINSDDAVD